ncbi:MAG: Hpt domain-containing protein [Candidatus Omnitrophica bacterium]|nr:Hpt domain-containing protein [Candidatus Omnitrophota bacterium]MDD5671078.1 Hpt domain-containing protein [Candidatus Omnitrophota bacterium]
MDNSEKAKILRELGGMDEAVYDGLVKDMLGELPGQIAEIKEFFNQNNFESVKRVAHCIHGTAANFRVYSIQRVAASLEDAVKTSKGKDDIRSKIGELEKVIREFTI